MRFRTYQNARPGISQMLGAMAAPGGRVYGDQMRDLAYVDGTQANARHADSETALNQQTQGARDSVLGALQGVPLPQGLSPDLVSSMFVGSANPNFRDFTQGMVDMGGTEAQRGALDAAGRGDTDSLNRFSVASKPGAVYEPYNVNETASYNAATGAGQFTPGHQAQVTARNAAANASNAAAGNSAAGARANDALADQRGRVTLAPGHSLYLPEQERVATAPGIVGKMQDGRPVVQNPDQTISTHRMATVSGDPRLNGGRATLVPTMKDGRQLTVDQALEGVVMAGGKDPTTGQPLRSYASPDEAEVDYALRQHPKIDREASWVQRQYQEKAGDRVRNTFNQAVTAPMTPQQQGAGGAGGASSIAPNAQLWSLFNVPAVNENGTPAYDPLTGAQAIDPGKTVAAKTEFVRWYESNEARFASLNEAIIAYVSEGHGAPSGQAGPPPGAPTSKNPKTGERSYYDGRAWVKY